MDKVVERRNVVRAGVVLGVGLGGFVDGIVLHQILQWHHMLSSTYAPDSVQNLQLNTFWDGLFHASTWVVTTVGLAMLWQAAQSGRLAISGKVLVGALGIGWGLFNLVEGIIDHHILRIHHVRPGPNELFWDSAFLAFGAVLVALGTWLIRQPPADVRRPEVTAH
jgi:uncharacterized membrane protein